MNQLYHISNILFGHKENLSNFLNMYENNKLPHSMLFIGTFGIGKSTFAHIISTLILSDLNALKEDEKGNSFLDSEDKNFIQIIQNTHPDFLRISLEEKKTNIPVAEIRKIQIFLSTKPIFSKKKVVIIEDAETLNINASNALLKILEEPSDSTNIILVSRSIGNIIQTIRSRCFKMYFTNLNFQIWSNILQYKNYTQFITPELYTLTNSSINHTIRFMESDIVEELMHFYKGNYNLDLIKKIIEFATLSQNNWYIIETILLMQLEESVIKSQKENDFYKKNDILYKARYLLKQTNILNLNKKQVLLTILAK